MLSQVCKVVVKLSLSQDRWAGLQILPPFLQMSQCAASAWSSRTPRAGVERRLGFHTASDVWVQYHSAPPTIQYVAMYQPWHMQ